MTTMRSASVMASSWSWVTINEGALERLVQPVAFRAQLTAQLGVEARQRLVEQEGGRVGDQSAGERDALGFSAGTLVRHFFEQMADTHHLRHFAHAVYALLRRHLFHAQAELDVLRNVLVREQGVALEHHAEPAVARFQVVDHAPVDADLAGSRILEAGDHAQRRGLAATGGADKDDELAVLDGESQVFHRFDGAERLFQIAQLDARHRYLRTIPKLKPRARCLRMISPTIMRGIVMPTASAAWRP